MGKPKIKDQPQNRFRKMLYTLKRIHVNLEDSSINKNDPTFLEYLCKELADVSYELHLMALERGDEWSAVRIFDECVKPFMEMRKIFKSLAKKREGVK